jgi:predicted ester cyclase
MSDENKKLIARSFEVINRGDMNALTQSIDSKFQNVFADVAKRAHAAFPDMKLTVEDTIAEGDKVVTRWTLTGTHKGESRHSRLGVVRPTNRHVKISGITIHRIENGKIVESWGETGKLEALEQLGLVGAFAKVASNEHR